MSFCVNIKHTCHTRNCLNCTDLPRKLTTMGVKNFLIITIWHFLSSFNSMVNNFFLFFFFLVRARQLKPQLNFLRRGRCDRQMAKVQKAFTRILPAGQEWSPSFVGKDATMWSAYTTMMPVHCSFTTLLCPYFFFYRVPRMSFNIFI